MGVKRAHERRTNGWREEVGVKGNCKKKLTRSLTRAGHAERVGDEKLERAYAKNVQGKRGETGPKLG